MGPLSVIALGLFAQGVLVSATDQPDDETEWSDAYFDDEDDDNEYDEVYYLGTLRPFELD